MGAKKTFFWENLPPEKLWYLVGLITADGCLSPDGRHIDITANDKKNRSFAHCIAIGSKDFYNFLLGINLTSKKSLTLGMLKIPDTFFAHFLRGVIDGDGCIRKWQNLHCNTIQRYFKINSGSEKFLIWINEMLGKIFDAKGSIHFEKYLNTTGYILKVSKKLYISKILQACYENREVALPRKRAQALECVTALQYARMAERSTQQT